VETRYTWCGDTICQTRDGKDQPLAYYFSEGTFRPEPNTPVGKSLGEREYYAKDHLGSVRDVLDQEGKDQEGKVQASFDCDPWNLLADNPFIPQQAIGRRSPFDARESWDSQHPELFTAPVMLKDYSHAKCDAMAGRHVGYWFSRLARAEDFGV
jgi:hypothetical protein